jgi:hypothetical protein
MVSDYLCKRGKSTPAAEELERVRTMCALNARLALVELVGHEFLDGALHRQRFTYADGTAVTIDLDSGTWEIAPKLEVPELIR